MKVVEDVWIMAADRPLRSIVRDEELLLSPPPERPVTAWQDRPPLAAVHFDQEFHPEPFALPRVAFEHDELRVEWQKMDNRQPFFHRNADVDELSYQIAGERTLMTELGVVELRPGDFSRIPRGVGHDNYGRAESHLLFYIPAPVAEVAPPTAVSQRVVPPFPGWEPGEAIELVTQCMAGAGHDVVAFPVDERDLFDQVPNEHERIQVLRAGPGQGRTALYRAEKVHLDAVTTTPGATRRYRRVLDADEIQYQVRGHRTLRTQRGVLELGPGDFVHIPLGIASCGVASEESEESEHISLLSRIEVRPVAEPTSVAAPNEPARLNGVVPGPASS